MEKKSCIYCGRAFGVDQLLERAGTYRCKDENNCLEYQAGDDPADSMDNADYISDLVKSSLAGAAERIAAYGETRGDRSKSGPGDRVEMSDESIDEAMWVKSALEALAQEYKEKQSFVFQFDETGNTAHTVSFSDAGQDLHVTVKIEHQGGSQFSLIAARQDQTENAEPLYGEFIYKSYPGDRREELIGDLSVILVALEGEKDRIPAVLNAFRREIESRCYHEDAGNE